MMLLKRCVNMNQLYLPDLPKSSMGRLLKLHFFAVTPYANPYQPNSF
jgi:hypothetical protein